MFPTVAHQLAAGHSQLHQIIGDAVIKSPDIDYAVASEQFQTLIGTPLDAFCAKSGSAGNILIVLDALDECQGFEEKRPQDILARLRDHAYQAAPRIRILLTSRPEHYLRRELACRHQVVEYNLHQDDESAQGDITRFLKAKLPLIPDDLGISVEDWPQDKDVQMLSEKSGHLFIFAKTALRFIGDDQVSDPKRQMNTLLGMDNSAVNPYSPLDLLYHQVLENALSRERVPDDIFLRFRRVVGCIILSQDALPVSVIARVANYSVNEVMATLLRLRSVILCSSPPGTVTKRDSDLLPHAYHPSFPDYLLNSKRCSDYHFAIIKPEMHRFIVLRCFELMKATLCRNILDLDDTYVFNKDIPDLEVKVQSCITPESTYACQFWLGHLLESEIDESILGVLDEFLSERFLWWCEALSLLDSACSGQKHLLATVAFRLQTAWEKMVSSFTSIVNITSDIVVQVKTSCNAETLELLNDTYQFLFSHHQTISESAMHTYYSALPFTPHNTRLYHLYEQEASHSITVLQGLSPTWTSCLSTLSLSGAGERILNISPDGMWLAVGYHTGIMILDARTTAPQCQFFLTTCLRCLAFSPSESTLAIVTSGSLELWNTTTGINQKTQMLRSPFINEVAFSLQGQYLLLSIAHRLHLHDGKDAGELSVLSTDRRHTKIMFASNDEQVITGSKEGYIHFFTLSGNQLREIQERRIFNETEVCGLVLRHDGQRLASSGADGTIRIYDLPSRSHIATLRRPESTLWSPIRAIAYHPTEEELAVGDYDYDGVVSLWRQKETPSDWMPSIHSNHREPIFGIAYCQNGTQMYTSTQAGGVKLWTTMVTRVQEPPKHTSIVRCHAAYQPTSLLATGSAGASIMLWNLATGNYWKTLRSHKDWIRSLEFSDNGVLLAAGTGHRTTIVWDVASSSCLHTLGPHDSCGSVLAFSEDNAHLTTTTYKECFVWELESGKLLERRYRDMFVGEAHRTPYYLKNLNGWPTVASASKNCKYGLCRPPGEYEISLGNGPIIGDRAVLFCNDGRVLILDISRVMHVHMDPARQIECRLVGPRPPL